MIINRKPKNRFPLKGFVSIGNSMDIPELIKMTKYHEVAGGRVRSQEIRGIEVVIL